MLVLYSFKSILHLSTNKRIWDPRGKIILDEQYKLTPIKGNLKGFFHSSHTGILLC